VGHLSTLRTTTRVTSVERDCLLARLRDDAEVPVVFVHGPAGYGKTTLAQQWAEQDPRPHPTVRLTASYDDPAALALELIDVLEPIGPSAGQIRSVATGTEPGFSALLLPAITRLSS
jgi:ATP/maltotriose-dependent transcriptional regulator MalT